MPCLIVICGVQKLRVQMASIFDHEEPASCPTTTTHFALTSDRSYRTVSGKSSLSGNVTEAAMVDLTQRLPIEVLAEILGHASAPEILRSKQVESPSLIYGHFN